MNEQPMNRTDPELLISRIVDGEATPTDWAAFRAQAERDASLWRELAEAQRAQAELSMEVASALSVVNAVDVPVHTEMVRRMSDRFRQVGMWGGWLAAACVGLMWAGGQRTGGSGTGQEAGLVSGLTPASALQAYLDQGQTTGRVIGELPEKLLIRAEPVTDADGTSITGYNIVYVRQIMERTLVKDLYRFGGADEAGQPRAVRVDLRPAGRPM
ncbi:MAG: hypothetical protein KF678_11825 [Phycisphaeraceae bacterium]|nr:hypothetical protein [Phycisphaeraceae bacterium]